MTKKSVLFNIKELQQLIEKAMFKHINVKLDYKPTATQVRFIDYLTKHDEVYGRDLEKYFHISRATVSDVLNTMEKHKIITRVSNNVDTRVKKIILNDEYKKIHKIIHDEIKKINEVIMKDIASDEIKIFNDVLNKMQENMYCFQKERCDKND